MLNKQRYQLSKNILLRHEGSIDSGTFFIFNILNQDIWLGNTSSKLLIELIDGNNTINEIKEKLSIILGVESSADLSSNVDGILTELLEKQMIVLVWYESN